MPEPMTGALAGVLAGALAALVLPVSPASSSASSSPSATPEPVPHEKVLTFQDAEIAESSGLVVTADHVVTTNDSGDRGRVFTVDPETGRTIGVTTWPTRPRDVEALAPAGSDQVWVADIGDNGFDRSAVSVHRVPVGESQTVEPEVFQLTYPDRPRDAESLMAHPRTGRLFVVTKRLLGGSVYAAPENLLAARPNVMQELGPVIGLATDAAFFPDGHHFVVRNYGEAAVYAFPSLEQVGAFPLPRQPQGEAIAVDAQDRLWLSTEGAGRPLLRMEVPDHVRRAMGPRATEPTDDPGDGPTAAPDDPAAPDPSEEPGPASQPLWPWAFGGIVLFGIVVVLVRSLRPG